MKKLYIISVFLLPMATVTYAQNRMSYTIDGITMEYTVSEETMDSALNPRRERTLIYSDGTQEIPNGQLIIKIKANQNLNQILTGINFTSEVNEFDGNRYLIQTNLNANALFTLVTNLNNDNRIVYAEPNFMKILNLLLFISILIQGKVFIMKNLLM